MIALLNPIVYKTARDIVIKTCFFFFVVFCPYIDCQPNQYFQVVFKIWVLKWLQKIRILFVFKEINYHVLK